MTLSRNKLVDKFEFRLMDKLRWFCVWLFALVFSIPVRAIAQEPFYYHYTIEEGLPDMELYSLYQSRDKFLWAGSAKGLVKFDGSKFTTYQSPAQVSGSISGITQDAFHRIWCHDFSGRIFILQNDTLMLFKHWDPEKSSTFPRIYFDEDNSLYILTDNEITLYKPDFNFKDYLPVKTIKLKNILTYGKPGIGLFLYSEKGIAQVDKNLNIHYFKDSNGQTSFPDIEGRLIFLKNGTEYYFISGTFKWYKLNMLNYSYQLQGQLPKTSVLINATYIENNLWICTFDGVEHYWVSGTTVTKIGDYFKSCQVADVITDHEGNYWVSTLNEGLYMIPSLQIRWTSHQNSNLIGRRVLRIASSNKYLFFGLANGNLYRTQQNELTKINNSTSKQPVISIYVDTTQNRLYYASDFIYEAKGTNYKQSQKLLSNGGVKGLLVTPRNLIIQGIGNGLYVHVPKTTTIEKSVPRWMLPMLNETYLNFGSQVYTKTYTLLNKRIVFVLGDPELNSLWVGTKDGVYHIDRKGIHQPLFGGNVIHGMNATIYKDEVWIATINNGILKIKNDTITQIGEKEGLAGNRTAKVSIHQNKAFILSDRALQSYDLLTGKWETLNENDGIIPKLINDFEIYNHRIWLGTSKGLIDLPINLPLLKPNPPVLFLKGVYAADQLLFTNSKNTIDLPYGKYNLKIKLGAVSFRNKGHFKIQYRIVGWNNEWYAPLDESNTVIELTTLPPGSYGFEARASNQDGMVSSSLIKLNITIAPPFWRKTWFIIFTVLGITGIISLIFRLRVKAINHSNQLLLDKERLEKELKASTLASIKSQMNPHFLFNSLNTIQNYIYKDERKQANYFLGKFSDLMRKILRLSSKEKITLEEEIETLGLYLDLEKMRFQESLEVTLIIDEKLDLGSVFIPAMIIQPFIENALKHGLMPLKKNKQLAITFKEESPNFLLVTIEDNGVGRKASAEKNKRKNIQHNSYSSEANKKRLELLNGNNETKKIALEIIDKTDEKNAASGTIVNLRIPF